MTTTKSFDNLNRLTQISSAPSASSAVNFGYSYNDVNQRVRTAQADGSYWRYEYDSLGQVKSGKKYWNDQTPVAGQQFEYGFDDIGNRQSTKSGGDAAGSSLRLANYTANNLNQYTSRDVPGYADIFGLTFATYTTTVNSQSAERKGEYFRKELSVANSSIPVWQSVTVATNGVTGLSGNVFVPWTPEAFTHDADGNLTQDGRWSYEWDGENRLKLMRSLAGSPAPERRIEFEHDSRGRRVRQTVWNDRDNGEGSELSDTLYLYDGWNLIAELNANASNARVRTYTWGLDLSGSEQGAGGVGGLLQVAYYGAQTTNCFAAFDGNGNVAALVNANDGATVAQYEYGPFGEMVRATGPMAKLNPVRFSSKYQDNETDLLYYGYRYYLPSTGRWLSRDPIGESGEGNLYGFAGNNPITYFDVLGLWRSYEHRNLTQLAWNTGGVPDGARRISSIYATIENANIAVDHGASQNDLRRHYNRGLNEDIAFARQRYSEWLRLIQTLFDSHLEHPSRTSCESALNRLGQLTHSWEDYYAHAIGVNSPYRGDPGPIRGDPDAPSTELKPSSWGWWYSPAGWGEHGFSEPAWREADEGLDRKVKTIHFVAGKFGAEMPTWWNACHCFYEQ